VIVMALGLIEVRTTTGQNLCGVSGQYCQPKLKLLQATVVEIRFHSLRIGPRGH
jgi:hypothetical protein